ncbi:hypothetical protein SAMN04488072_10899 [Lentibacillus halodurans]|uniref:Permuted papain-like amidase enzyme, YaeF/YiiX, C92 family n=1 Tax=Lentibacillus halodurans TaxID=237679 RepID=A0A1I0YT45_9BACI|nr:hypothetical protein [Lentibacillus halodurans]SFB15488.1 hypothetical protein SAMN04488072_10899 [Lentibacillus halodurans]
MTEKKVYILLTDTGSLFTKMIKLYTKKTYNHASISLDSELAEVYSFGRKKVENPFNGGFVKEDLKKGLFKQADCAIYSFTVTEAQMQQISSYIKEIEGQKEYYRYNFLGLFGFIFNKPIIRERAFFCSQFVAAVLKECNIIDFEKPLSLIAPNDLLKASNFQFVYEGKLKNYHHKDGNEELGVPLHYIPVEMS